MISRDLLLILGLCLVLLLPAHCQRPTRRPPTRATQCRATGNLEIPGYCRVYLACGTANGEGSVMRCPDGTTFNGDIGNCDNIELSDHRCFRGTNNNNNRRPINNNNNFNTRRPNNNNNNFNTRRPNNNNNFNNRRPNNNNNNFNTRRPNNSNNFNTRRPNNNNNNNQRNGRRNVFQGSPQISVPLTLPRGQVGDCRRLENVINNDFRSRVRGAAGRDVPNIPTLRLECTFQNRNQNQNQNWNQNWSQVRG